MGNDSNIIFEITSSHSLTLAIYKETEFEIKLTAIIIIIFICKAPYIRNFVRSEAHKIHCNTYIFKIFIISLNFHVKTKW